MYGQAESVFLMDLSLEEPAGAVFINPARLGFGTLFAVHSSGGGGDEICTPYNSLHGEALPKRGTFSRLQENERVGISLIEIYEKKLVAQKISKLKSV